jgi:hypothetical protein
VTSAVAGRYSWKIVLCAGLVSACAGAPSEPSVPNATLPVEFSYRTLDGEVLDASHTRGRATALLFVTTFDWASQVEAKRLAAVLARLRPRANAVAVVVETEKYRPLAEVFRSSLGFTYPLAMADEATRLGEGPFGPVARVPLLVVLDRSGRETWRKAGLAESAEIDKALVRASRSGTGPPQSR